MTYKYQVISAFVHWDHGTKSFCVAIVYLQTMRGFHVEVVGLTTCVEAEVSTGTTDSGVLKK